MSSSFEVLQGAETRNATAARETAGSADAARPRLDSIDLLRGLIMCLMALDHVRDFFAPGGMNPRDVTDGALFLTRWITHYCAPTFIFLAGISAWLYGARGRSTAQLSRFLLTRGFWLIVIEFTLVRFAWRFAVDVQLFVAQVIFAIGASMVVLSALVFLPRWAIAGIGLAMILAHNLLDGITAEQLGAAAFAWHILHQPGMLRAGDTTLFVLYPLIPWIGVMAAGYALGPVFRLDRAARTRWLLILGAVTTIGFVALRASNVYGDPVAWTHHDGALATVLSFLNCEKYPPSLLYLAMTLGPALLLLAAFEGVRGRIADWIIAFGRVPFLFYVAHLFLIHILAVAFSGATIGDVTWLFGGMPGNKPAGYGLPLPGVYAVWVFVLFALHPLCRWFASVKQRRREWWLSYL
jgi:uncharacterized membrane protein